jgi:hypothetical protein
MLEGVQQKGAEPAAPGIRQAEVFLLQEPGEELLREILGISTCSMISRISSFTGFCPPSPSIFGIALSNTCRKSSRPGRK